MTDIYNYDNLTRKIITNTYTYLIFNPDIFSINPFIDFLKFYASFVIPNMGINRFEVDFDSLLALKGNEKELAIEILTKNMSVPYYTGVYSEGLKKLQVLQLDNILTEQYYTALKAKNYLSVLALAREIKRYKISNEFNEIIEEILREGTEEEKCSAIYSTSTLTPESCYSICIKYLDSPVYKLRVAAYFGLKIHSDLTASFPRDEAVHKLSSWNMDESGNYYNGYDLFLSDEVFKNKELFQKKKEELLGILYLDQTRHR
jgi:hypothetical protein